MIDSIELTNWKTHSHTVLNFQKGVNVLIGVMGAGKSSVTDAMSFALFGTFPALSERRTSLKNVISDRPHAESSAEVKLNFSVDSDSYTITRSISRTKPSEARLEKNGEYLQAQPERVNDEIAHLLKIDYDTFSRVIYSEQNRLSYFLDLERRKRKSEIDHMLGLDSFATAEENATSLINSVKSLAQEDEKFLAGLDVASLKEQLANIAESKQKLEKEQSAAADAAKGASTTIESLSKQLASLKELSDKKKKLGNEIAALQSRLSTLKESLGKLAIKEGDEKSISQKLADARKESESLDKTLKSIRAEHDALAKELGGIETGIASGEKDRAERDKLAAKLKTPPADLKDAAARVDAELKKLTNDSAELKAKKTELASWISELKKHITACPVCNRALDTEMKEKLLSEKSAALSALEKSITQCDAALADAARKSKSALEDYNAALLASEKLKGFDGIEEKLKKLAEQEKSAKAKLSGLASDIESKSASKDKTGKELLALANDLESISKKKAYEADIAKATASLDEKGKEHDALKFDEKELDSLQDALQKQSAILADANAKVASAKRLMSELDAQSADKAKQIKNTESMRERIERRRNQVGELTKFKKALVETETLLRGQLVMSINGMMQNMWGELYPYADYSAIRLNALKDDYLLEALAGTASEGAWVDVDAIASGGERSMACLAMRIAMAMVTVPNLRWLILDEPTHNIDEQGIARIVDIFGSTLPRVVEQIFIITHDQELKNIGSARVYLLERSKEKGEPTSVSEL